MFRHFSMSASCENSEFRCKMPRQFIFSWRKRTNPQMRPVYWVNILFFKHIPHTLQCVSLTFTPYSRRSRLSGTAGRPCRQVLCCGGWRSQQTNKKTEQGRWFLQTYTGVIGLSRPTVRCGRRIRTSLCAVSIWQPLTESLHYLDPGDSLFMI